MSASSQPSATNGADSPLVAAPSAAAAAGGGGGSALATTSGMTAGNATSPAAAAAAEEPHIHMPLKQKVAVSFKSLLGAARKLALGDDGSESTTGPAPLMGLFPKTDPVVDGDECLHDCDSCTIRYPRNFKTEEQDLLYGHVNAWSTHLLVATGKTDWVREVEHEKGSVMEAFGKAASPSNGKLKLSASNIPTPSGAVDYSEPTTVLLLPAFIMIDHVTPESVPTLIDEYINHAPTNTDPLKPVCLPPAIPSTRLETQTTNGSSSTSKRNSKATSSAVAPPPAPTQLLSCRPCPHRALILLCSQRTRDARCGQSAPLLRKELERHLRPLGLYRDVDDERPGGVGIYFISHVGGHKYSANVMVYRRPDAFGMDDVERAKDRDAKPAAVVVASPTQNDEPASNGIEDGETQGNGSVDGGEGVGDEIVTGDVGAGQCIWLARVRPEDCENLIRYTVLQGKVVKPERQLRGGFDRGRGLLSW